MLFLKFRSFSKTNQVLCAYTNKSDHTTVVNTLHWLYLACVWYVLDTCWSNIFNRKQCSTAGIKVVYGQVKMKNAVLQVAKWTTQMTRTVDFATPG